MGDEARNACRGPPPCSLRNLKSGIPKKGEVPVKGTNFFRAKAASKTAQNDGHFPIARSVVYGSGVQGEAGDARPRMPIRTARPGMPPGTPIRTATRLRTPPETWNPEKNCAVPVKGTKFPGRQPRPQPPPPSRTSPMTESGFGRCAAPPSRTILGFWEEFWTFGREIPEKLTIFLKKRKIFRI